MFNNKIVLSSLSIVSALIIVGGATYAFFTSNQQILGNTVSTGNLSFQAIVQDGTGSSTGDAGKFSEAGLNPGESFTRCLWVANQGTVAGRYKIYASAESGNLELGNNLSTTLKMNPTDGVCSDNTNPFEATAPNQYGPNDLTQTIWTDVPSRGSFLSASTTPYKIAKDTEAMEGGFYSLFEVVTTLDEAATQANASYVADITVEGAQDEASGPTSTW